MRPDVLVVGAGPTGLAAALYAHDHGANVRVVERRATAFRPSHALVMHARTLEVLRPAGVVDDLLERADTAPRAMLRLGTHTIPVTLAGFDWPDTPFAHLTLIRQMDVEAVLARALGVRGIPIERDTELITLRDLGPAGGVTVRLRSPSGTERARCRFLVGCDGTDSTVRELAGIGWNGRPYRPEIVAADLNLEGHHPLPGVAHVVAGRRGVVFLFAQGELARWRLLATRPASGEAGTAPGSGELQRVLDDAGLPVRIAAVGWSERIRVQHRMASRYRQGSVFLAGDAAHTHSPATAQGMNTGIQDAANLGWKLAFAPSSSATAALLDSYEQERRPVARRVVALTHAAFWAEAGTGPVPSFLRGVVAPLAAPVAPIVLCRGRVIARVARVLSQLGTRYPAGTPVTGDGPWPRGPRAGERLPDAMVTCGGRRLPLHRLLDRPGVHVLLQRDSRGPDLRLRAPFGHVHRLTDRPGSGVLVVRPDGYVGYCSATVDDDRLGAWLSVVGASTGDLSGEATGEL